jgi:hypothetical protein
MIPIAPDRVKTGLNFENTAAILNSVNVAMIVSDSLKTPNRSYISVMDLWNSKQMLVL